MEALLMDKNFKAISIIDNFKSMIWTDRYNAYGDFELYLVMDLSLLEIIKKDYYLWMSESNHVMIIEKIEIDSDVETGNFMIVTGKSLESILDRRIVWKQTQISGDLQSGIQKLLNDAIISPEIADRKIENFIFEKSTDPYITSLKMDAQYTGDNLYEVIQKICNICGMGFQILLSEDNKFIFKLYKGTDRSFAQDENPYVIFSPNYDNVISSNYLTSNTNWKNVTLVAGEGEGEERKTEIVGSGTGLERRELYTDARDISSMLEDGSNMSTTEYQAKLIQRGTEKLAERIIETAFEGEMETTRMFKYNEHFKIGDIVQIADAYGNEERVYVSEFIFSQDDSGISMYPTFKTL